MSLSPRGDVTLGEVAEPRVLSARARNDVDELSTPSIDVAHRLARAEFGVGHVGEFRIPHQSP